MNDEPQTKAREEVIKAISNFTLGDEPFQLRNDLPYSDETIAHWTSIPPDAQVQFPLTRRDLDHLFFSYAQLGATISMLQSALQALTQNDLAAASAAFGKSIELRAMADNNFRVFFGSIMKNATSNG